jgi:hypothetical protein
LTTNSKPHRKEFKKSNVTALLLIAGSAFSQTPGFNPTNAPPFPTNQVEQVASGSAVATFALNLLPYWDKTMTNAYNAKELELIAAPTWKSVAASGSTPYLSIGADYWFTKYFGFGADALTFGSGSGSSDLEGGHAYFLGRKALGNVAGILLLGGGRDKNLNLWNVEAGVGIEFRYKTGVGFLVDTRYIRYVDSGTGPDHELLTRVGVTLHF